MFISRKKFDELVKANNQLVESLQKITVLTNIQRVGRENVFTFRRGDKVVQIGTMGLISDPVQQWKEELL